MDGVVIGTAPLVPVDNTSAVPMAHIVDTTLASAPGVPASPATRRRPTFSFAVVGRSTFSFTFSTPSLGDYIIMASIFSPDGKKVPTSNPAVSSVPNVSIHKHPIDNQNAVDLAMCSKRARGRLASDQPCCTKHRNINTGRTSYQHP